MNSCSGFTHILTFDEVQTFSNIWYDILINSMVSATMPEAGSLGSQIVARTAQEIAPDFFSLARETCMKFALAEKL